MDERTSVWWRDGVMVIESDGGSANDDDQHFVGDAASEDDADRIVDWHNAALTGRPRTLAARSEPGAEGHEHDFKRTFVDGVVVDIRCACGAQPIDLFDTMTLAATPAADSRPHKVITDHSVTGDRRESCICGCPNGFTPAADSRGLDVLSVLRNSDVEMAVEIVRFVGGPSLPYHTRKRREKWVMEQLAAVRASAATPAADTPALDERSAKMRWLALEAVRSLVGYHPTHPNRDDPGCAVCRFYLADAALTDPDPVTCTSYQCGHDKSRHVDGDEHPCMDCVYCKGFIGSVT
jgi:hypothetical protein